MDLQKFSAALRSVLQSSQNGVNLKDLNSDFQCLVGEPIPFKQLGFASLEDMIHNMPNVAKLTGDGRVVGVTDESTRHLQDLIAKQKPKKKNVTNYRKKTKAGPTYSYAKCYSRPQTRSVPNVRRPTFSGNARFTNVNFQNYSTPTSFVRRSPKIHYTNNTEKENIDPRYSNPNTSFSSGSSGASESTKINRNYKQELEKYSSRRNLNVTFSSHFNKVGDTYNSIAEVAIGSSKFSSVPQTFHTFEEAENEAIKKALASFDGWHSLNLHPRLWAFLKMLGYFAPRSVQAKAIPLILSNQSAVMLGIKQSGKSMALVISIFEKLLSKPPTNFKEVRAIITWPSYSRDVEEDIKNYLNIFVNHFTEFTLFAPGNKLEAAVSRFQAKGGHIVIGSLDKVKRFTNEWCVMPCLKNIDIFGVCGANLIASEVSQLLPDDANPRVFVLEGDESNQAIDHFARTHLKNAHYINTQKADEVKAIKKVSIEEGENYYLSVEPELRLSSLVKFLTIWKEARLVIFVSTSSTAELLTKLLPDLLPRERPIFFLNPDDTVEKRTQSLKEFDDQDTALLFCTSPREISQGNLSKAKWLIQYDPFSCFPGLHKDCYNPLKSGQNNLLFLMKNEIEYFGYLKDRGIVLKVMPPFAAVEDLVPKLMDDNFKQGLLQLSLTAFISYIKSYSNYDSTLPFRLTGLDLTKLANGYGLIKTEAE